jgi:subtilisin
MPNNIPSFILRDGLALKYLKEQSPDTVLAAVKQNGLALQFAKHQSDEIALAAVRQNPKALQFVKNKNLEILKAAAEAEGPPSNRNPAENHDPQCPIRSILEKNDGSLGLASAQDRCTSLYGGLSAGDEQDLRKVIEIPKNERETETKLYHREGLDFPDAAQVIDWGHTNLDLPRVYADFKVTGKGVKIGMCDTGVDARHEDLNVLEGMDFTNSPNGTLDILGHGTHCSGICAAKDNSLGVMGVAPDAAILPVKVLSDTGSGQVGWIISGIDWAATHGANVISLSLGGGGSTTSVMIAAIKRAIAAGAIVCIAAGNSGPGEGTVGSPGNYLPAVTVGASDSKNVVASFSSRGPEVDIVAPGVSIFSTFPSNRYTMMSGTSMATPYVSGVAALYTELSMKNGWPRSHSHFESLAKRTALDLGTPGSDTSYGAGLIRPYEMFKVYASENASPIPPPPLPIPVPPKQTSVALTFIDGSKQQFTGVAEVDVKAV